MKALLPLFGLLIVAILAIAFMFGAVVAPGFIGVRQTKFGLSQGFSTNGLQPGYHWSIPFYSIIHFIPQTVQLLHFHREDTESRFGTSFPSLEIQTADRASVDVDFTVLSRFYDAPGVDNGIKHGGPADLLQTVGISEERWNNHIRRTAEDELKRSLGSISTGEFYDPFIREKAIEEAQANLRKSLAPSGVAIEAVLLRRYTYREDRIDFAIFQKNLQDQEERLNVTASKFAEAQAALEQVAAEWDAKIQTLRVEGENKARVTRSEGDLYEQTRVSEADLSVAKAKAEVDRLKASALSSAHGAEAYVARELTPLLGTLRGGVVSGVDPYDLDAWAKKLGVGKE